MNVVSAFDPWKNPLCTCQRKYTLSPYTGCEHACQYCYTTAYIPRAFNARAKKDFLAKLRRDVERLDRSMHVSMSNSSDPYTPAEKELQLTRQSLKLLIDAGLKVQLITKSNTVTRDIDIIQERSCSVSLTITTLDEEKAKRLEPYAPSPKSRLEALRKLTNSGVPCSVRIDPIVPGINEDAAQLVAAVHEAGARHVVVSTYKAKRDSLARVVAAFPELEGELTRTYLVEGTIQGRARYLRLGIREAILGRIKELAEGYGMTYGTCREGLQWLNSGATCDGSHLIP